MPENGSSDLARGYPLAILSALVLSTTGIFIRYLTQRYQMPALLLAFWRDTLVAISLLLILSLGFRRLLHVRRSQLGYLLFFGGMLAVFNALWTVSVALNGAAVSTVLVYSSTAFTALLGRWLLKEPLDWARLGAVALCLAGCAMVSDALLPRAWHANAVGILTGVLSGLWYAIYSLLGRSAARRGLSPWTTMVYTFSAAAGLLLLLNLASALFPGLRLIPGSAPYPIDFFWLKDAVGWLILVVLAVGPTLLGFGMYNISLGYLSSNLANLILTTEPAFTVIIAFFVLGERLNWVQFSGSALILLSVFFLRLYEGSKQKKAQIPNPESLQIPAGD